MFRKQRNLCSPFMLSSTSILLVYCNYTDDKDRRSKGKLRLLPRNNSRASQTVSRQDARTNTVCCRNISLQSLVVIARKLNLMERRWAYYHRVKRLPVCNCKASWVWQNCQHHGNYCCVQCNSLLYFRILLALWGPITRIQESTKETIP